VATIIELARYYKASPLNNIFFKFLITGSEELNLGGAYDYIQTHYREFDPKNTFFIDFDVIGGKGAIFIVSADGIPKKVNDSRLIQYFIKSGQKLKIQVDSKYIPTGAWGDHTPIIKKGFEACFVGSLGSEKKVHTKYDNMDLVSKQGLKNVLILTDEVIKLIQQDFE
jgi:Zn-dependent M28 family amino/carboxypeptidase